MYGQNKIEEQDMHSIDEALMLAEAGFNVRITGPGVVEILSDAEVASIIEEGDE